LVNLTGSYIRKQAGTFFSEHSVYWQRYCTALEQRPSAKLCGVVQGIEFRNLRRGRHLYSAGRPSRWASAHILHRVSKKRPTFNLL